MIVSTGWLPWKPTMSRLPRVLGGLSVPSTLLGVAGVRWEREGLEEVPMLFSWQTDKKQPHWKRLYATEIHVKKGRPYCTLHWCTVFIFNNLDFHNDCIIFQAMCRLLTEYIKSLRTIVKNIFYNQAHIEIRNANDRANIIPNLK